MSISAGFLVIFDLPDGNQRLSTGMYLLSVLIHSGGTQINEAFGALKGFVCMQSLSVVYLS